MRPLYIYVALGAVVAALATGWYRSIQKLADARASANTYAEALREAGKQRQRDVALLGQRARANAAAAREMASMRLRLAAALETHSKWAEQPVPEDVRKAMDTRAWAPE